MTPLVNGETMPNDGYFGMPTQNGGLPDGLRRTNRHHAPIVAATVQVVLTVVTLVPFVLTHQDPIAIIAFFRRDQHGHSLWTTVIAPAAAFVAMAGGLVLILTNFDVLMPGSPATIAALLVPIPLVFAVGWLIAHRQGTTTGVRLIEPPVIADLAD